MKQITGEFLSVYNSCFPSKKTPGGYFEQATYIHPRIRIARSTILFPDELDLGLGIVSETENQRKRLYICNFHAPWKPGDKLDNPQRLKQSRRIIEYFSAISGPKIISGDFNLDINTESVRMFEKAGYKNLIRDHDVKTTRNKIAWARFLATPQLYSDYVFISPEVNVKSFSVPEIEISDHLPMILEIE